VGDVKKIEGRVREVDHKEPKDRKEPKGPQVVVVVDRQVLKDQLELKETKVIGGLKEQ
jgi:hypothetical protein